MKIISLIGLFLLFSFSYSEQNYKEIIPANYQNFYMFDNGITIAYTNDDYENLKADIFNNYGKKLISDVSKVSYFKNGIITYQDSHNNFFLLNKDGKNLIFQNNPTSAKGVGDDFISFQDEDGAINYLDLNFNKIQKPINFLIDKYQLISYLGYGNWIITLKEEKNEDDILLSPFGVVNQSGVKIEPKIGNFFEIFISGVSLFTTESGKYGYLDKNCNLIVDTILYAPDIGSNLENGITKYSNENFAGYIFAGKKAIPAEYDLSKLPLRYGNNFYFTKNNKYGVFDTLGNKLTEFSYDDITLAAQEISGYFIKKQGKLFGYTDKNNNFVIKPNFEFCYPFFGNFAIVKKNGKFGIIDKKGNLTVPNNYSNITYTDLENYFVFEINKKKGLIKIN